MSRDGNDALEEAQVKARALHEQLDGVLAHAAGLALQRDRLSERLESLKRKRHGLRSKLDGRPGSGLVTVIGFCVGAVVARLAWELRSQLIPDERVFLAVIALATSVALYVSRTHGFRFGLPRR